MTRSNILFIGMDVHKESIGIAIADGANQEVRRYGKIGGTQDAAKADFIGETAVFLLRGRSLWL